MIQKTQALEEALEISYRKGGLNASVQDSLSKGSVKNMIHSLVVEMPKPEVKEKKKIKILHINADVGPHWGLTLMTCLLFKATTHEVCVNLSAVA